VRLEGPLNYRLIPASSQTIQVHTLQHNFIRRTLMLSSHSCTSLANDLYPPDISTISFHVSIFITIPIHASCSFHLILCDFFVPINFSKAENGKLLVMWSAALCRFTLTSNYSPDDPALIPCLSILRQTKFHSHTKQHPPEGFSPRRGGRA
jgi:hypothetical protein